MIKTFRHKGLAEFFETGNARKVQAKHAKRLRMTKKHDELRRQQINCDPILIQSDVISLMRSD